MNTGQSTPQMMLATTSLGVSELGSMIAMVVASAIIM
jgi:hypothetical protein